MISLNQLLSKRLENIQYIQQKLNDKQMTKQQFIKWRKRIWEEDTIRKIKEEDALSYIKGLYLHNYKEIMSVREIYDLSLEIITNLEFDVPELEKYIENEYQEEDLLVILVEIFSVFFKFLSNYFEMKQTYKGIFRSSNKTMAFDILRYLIMFTRDYFQHLIMALQKHFQIENKQTKEPIQVRQLQRKLSLKKKISLKTQITYELPKPLRIHSQLHNILNIEQNTYHVQSMSIQQITEKSNEQYQLLKRRNAHVYFSRRINKQIPNIHKIKFNLGQLYSQSQLKKIREEILDSSNIRIYISENQKKKEKFLKLKRFAQQQMEKEAEIFKKPVVHEPKKIFIDCRYALKLTNKIDNPLELILFQPHIRRFSEVTTRLSSLKTTPSLSLKKTQKHFSQLKIPSINQPQKQQQTKQANTKQIIKMLESHKKKSITQRQLSLPRSKVIKMKNNNNHLILPTIFKKMISQRQYTSQQQVKDNMDLRDVMAFNRLKKPQQPNQQEPNNNNRLMEIISKQIYKVYI